MRIALWMMAALLPCAGQTPPKVAVINGQQALTSTQEGKKTLERMKAKMETKNKEFEARQIELAQLEEQLNKGAAVMTGDKKDQLALSINDKKKRLQRDSEDAREEAERDQQQSVQTLDEKMNAVIDRYASEHGYSLVIDYSTPGNPVRYRAAGIDITNDIVASYDKAHPAGRP